jgi:hypothetical protein
MAVNPDFGLHARLPEPELSFHPDRVEDRHAHPLLGLLKFGPYSRGLINRVVDPIRVATIVSAGERARVDGFLSEFGRQHKPKERLDYLPEYPGFRAVFHVNVVRADDAAHVELASDLEGRIATSPRPHLVLAEALTRAIGLLEARRADFDVLFVYLPKRWEVAFEGTGEETFDLHDYVKAVTATRGMPCQIILEEGALAYPCRASVMWHQGIALYAKAGGIPWKLADAEPETAFIGLSYATRVEADRGPRFFTCCSQVFDSDGAGLEFLLYETDDVTMVERDNPFLSRKEMRHVMSRSLALYQQRHAGRVPRRLVVHKNTRYTFDEVEACFEAFPGTQIDLLQVKQDFAWRGIQIGRPAAGSTRGLPTAFPCERGSYLPVGGRSVLLWTQGNLPGFALDGRNFYKEKRSIPAPLELVRFAGHGGWEASCRAVLGLSKMNWNNDALYDFLPVTMGYAQVLARVVSRMTDLGPRPYQLRFFM